MFEIEDIKKCAICGAENVKGIREGVTQDIGIGNSHGVEDFCEKCFKANIFINSYGFKFLRFKNKLFCYKPYKYLDFGFREVVSDNQIERAFNPEYYDFLEWMNE